MGFQFTFDVAVLSIFGDLDSPIKEKLRKNYCILDKGYNSFPLSLPGTSYNTSVSARKRIGQILFEIIRVRKEMNSVQNDFLGSLLNFKDEKGEILIRDDQILDNIIGVLFAAQDTTASILTWILKYIHDDPKLLEAIKKEQKPFFEANDGGNLLLTWAQTRNMPLTNRVIMESLRMASIISFTFREAVTGVEYNDEKGEILIRDDQILDNIIGVLFAAQDTTASILTWILKYIHDDPKLLEAIKKEQKPFFEANDGGNLLLTWAQTRNMPLTNRVIMESLRMASIISFTFREAVTGVEYNGYLIPKGWKVLPLFRNIHHNPNFFTEPQTFNTSRFEVGPKHNTFMPFGIGVHACPGNEVAKLEMLILIHHLVNKFRWEVVVSSGGVQYAPFPVPEQGLPAKFWKESSANMLGQD
nr:abscisic acid 8'-hydroxylase 3 [Quercus suber]